MIPAWLALLLVMFVCLGLRPTRAGRHPMVQSAVAVLAVVAYEGVHLHAL